MALTCAYVCVCIYINIWEDGRTEKEYRSRHANRDTYTCKLLHYYMPGGKIMSSTIIILKYYSDIIIYASLCSPSSSGIINSD